MSDVRDRVRETATFQPATPSTAVARRHLLVLEAERARDLPLPDDGAVVIGRGEDADLRIDDGSVSRRHARLVCAGGEVRISDLDSHNGTVVNGERIRGARVLVTGDVIVIGTATLVIRGVVAAPPRAVVELRVLRQRLAEEVERSLRYQRPLALVGIAAASEGRDAVVDALAGQLRLMDVLAWTDGVLLALLPELGQDEADEVATAMATGAAEAGGGGLGLALCPFDGCDADSLIAGVRAAARAAAPGVIRRVSDSATHLDIDGVEVVVAEPAMAAIYDLMRRLAQSELPVLITGETGTGKESAARAVHVWSRRSEGRFVTLNCAALQETLVESELFGYERGAFTGANTAKPGLLEVASGGTLFLDEVGELSLAAQAKLLRAIETQRVTRLGAVAEREVDVRIVAATNRRLEDEIDAGRFRSDLYFRLGAASVVLPALRERRREIPHMARRFLAAACARAGRPVPEISAEVMHRLLTYPWPGNVRELRNAIEYAAATLVGDLLDEPDLPPQLGGGGEEPAASADAPPAPAAAPANGPRFRKLADEVRELERRRMSEALAAAEGVRTRAAKLIGMPLRTFVHKLRQYDLGRGDEG